ncbi:hypothetical protein QTN25_004923 [Entamoeba marina]
MSNDSDSDTVPENDTETSETIEEEFETDIDITRRKTRHNTTAKTKRVPERKKKKIKEEQMIVEEEHPDKEELFVEEEQKPSKSPPLPTIKKKQKPELTESVEMNSQPKIKPEIPPLNTMSDNVSFVDQPLKNSTQNLSFDSKASSINKTFMIDNPIDLNQSPSQVSHQPIDTGLHQTGDKSLHQSKNMEMVVEERRPFSNDVDSNFKMRERQEIVQPLFHFGKVHDYEEMDGPYDPLIGLYKTQRRDIKESKKQWTQQDYTKLKSVISKFVVDCLQRYYDSRVISSRDEFKSVARSITIKYTNILFDMERWLTPDYKNEIANYIDDKYRFF